MSDPFNPLGVIADKITREGELALTRSELQYFALTWFVIEIQNGGLHQFFSNDAGKYAHEALDGLRQIGAMKSASILERAISIFPEHRVPKDRAERDHVLDSLPDELQWDLLSTLSSEYYTNREDIAGLFDRFVTAHRDEYPTFRKE
jgi:hypothetical protein